VRTSVGHKNTITAHNEAIFGGSDGQVDMIYWFKNERTMSWKDQEPRPQFRSEGGLEGPVLNWKIYKDYM
jgi:hypothetical protein